MMRASLILVLLQWQHQVHSLQSKQVRSLQSKQSKLAVENDVLQRVDIKLCNSDVHANLGGLGGVNIGDTGPEDKTENGDWKKELRYKKVATLPTGEKLDLVITNMTKYTANPVTPKPSTLEKDKAIGGEWLNGRKGCLGRVNIRAPGQVKLKFALVMQGSDIPAPANYRYDFTILDFDRSKYGMQEEVTVQGFEAYMAPNIEPTKVGEFLTFASPLAAVEVPNPDDPFRLTAAQINASVGFVYVNVSHWEITAKAIDTLNKLEGGRNFYFAGRTVLQANGKLHKFHNTDETESATKTWQHNPNKTEGKEETKSWQHKWSKTNETDNDTKSWQQKGNESMQNKSDDNEEMVSWHTWNKTVEKEHNWNNTDKNETKSWPQKWNKTSNNETLHKTERYLEAKAGIKPHLMKAEQLDTAEMTAEEKRKAEKKAFEDTLKAEEKKEAEELKAAEQKVKKAADAKKTSEQKELKAASEKRAAEEKKIVEEKKLREVMVEEKKASEERKAAEGRKKHASELKELAEEKEKKAAEEKKEAEKREEQAAEEKSAAEEQDNETELKAAERREEKAADEKKAAEERESEAAEQKEAAEEKENDAADDENDAKEKEKMASDERKRAEEKLAGVKEKALNKSAEEKKHAEEKVEHAVEEREAVKERNSRVAEAHKAAGVRKTAREQRLMQEKKDERDDKAAETKKKLEEKKEAEEEKKKVEAEKRAEQRRKADEKLAEEKAEARKKSDEKKAAEKAEERRKADEKRTAEAKKAAEERRKAAEEKLAEEKKAAEEKRAAEKRAAEEKKLAAEEKKTADKRAAEEEKAADKRAAEEEKAADERAAEEEKRGDIVAKSSTMVETAPSDCPPLIGEAEDGICVIYKDAKVDAAGKPNGPFRTRVAAFDFEYHEPSQLQDGYDVGAWHTSVPAKFTVDDSDAGDYWLVKNEKIKIQGRYNTSADLGGKRLGLVGLAVGGPAFGGAFIFVEPKSGKVWFDGKTISGKGEYAKATKTGSAHVRTYFNAFTQGGVAPSGVDIAFYSDAFIQVRRYNTHLDAKITLPKALGAIDGQCGNFNGRAEDDSIHAVRERMGDIKVSREELYFRSPFEES